MSLEQNEWKMLRGDGGFRKAGGWVFGNKREREREKKQIARQSPSRRLATPSFLASQVESLRQAVQQEHGEIAGLCGTSAWLWCEEILMSGAAWASLLPSIAKATGPV